MKHQALYSILNTCTGASYTPVPVDWDTAMRIHWRIRRNNHLLIVFVGYGVPYVGVFRR